MHDERTDVDRLRAQQKALASFGLLAFCSTDLQEILQRASELVAEGLDVRMSKVLEILPGGEKLLVRAGVNWKPGVVGHETFGAGHDSPAGYALLHDAPVISPDIASETRFAIPNMLVEHGIQSMVNVVIAGERSPFGVLEVDAPRHRHFDEDDIAFLQTYANLLAAAVERHHRHRVLESGMREQEILLHELEHRVKNMLTLVQALARQTTAETPEARDYRDAFLGRLQALARAENLAFHDDGQAIELRLLVERSVEAFRSGDARMLIEGCNLRLPARSGRILALVIHELGTNATKHGALSRPGGTVRIGWQLADTPEAGRISFEWSEAGGPPLSPPPHRGFGTKLLTTLASYELGGGAIIEHPPEGLRYRLDFPATPA